MPRGAIGQKPRRSKFMALGLLLDGERSATFTVETGAHPVVRVRPYRARREYVLPLGLACEVIAARAAKLGPVGVVLTRGER